MTNNQSINEKAHSIATLRADCPVCKAKLSLWDTGDGEWACENCHDGFPQSAIPRSKVTLVEAKQ